MGGRLRDMRSTHDATGARGSAADTAFRPDDRAFFDGELPTRVPRAVCGSVESEMRRDAGQTCGGERPVSTVDGVSIRRWENRLAQTIVSMVIPKLQSAHDGGARNHPEAIVAGLGLHVEAERFIALVLAGDPDRQWRALTDLRDAGMDTETIFLDIMTPAVRHLGELWEDDRMSFIDVTAKSARLQQMMRRLGAEDGTGPVSSHRRILLAPAPGEQHTFGLFLLAEMFLKIGWDTAVEPLLTLDELCARVRGEPYDAVGLSVGSERGLDRVGGCVSALRQASAFDGMRVFLGGWAFGSRSRPANDYGADLIATDARSAVDEAQILCPSVVAF